MTSLTHPNLIERLKPCPFCGDSAILKHWGGEVSVLCSNCNARSASLFAKNARQAIEAWNTRTNDQAISTLTAEVEELRALLGDVHRCRMEAGEGRFVNLAKLRKVMGRIDATLKGEGDKLP